MALEKFGIKLSGIEQPSENTVRLTIDFSGINKPGIFVQVAQMLVGKNFVRIWDFIMQFGATIPAALKKSK